MNLKQFVRSTRCFYMGLTMSKYFRGLIGSIVASLTELYVTYLILSYLKSTKR